MILQGRNRGLVATVRNIGAAIILYYIVSAIVGITKGILPQTLFALITIVLTLFLIGFILYEIFGGRVTQPVDMRRKAATKKTNLVIDESKVVFRFETIHSDIPYVNVTDPYRGNLVMGSPGSGKSASIIEQFIVQSIRKGFTGILYDYKYPDLAAVVKYAQEKYKSSTNFYTINLLNLNQSHRVNLLRPELMTVQSYADQFTTAILLNLKPESIEKSDYWTDEAKSYLSAVIWFLHEEYPQYCTLPHAVAMVLEDTNRVIELLSTNPETRGSIASLRGAIERKADSQVSGVDSTLKTALRKINTKEIAWVFSGDEFNLNLNDPEEPKFITLANQSDLKEVFGPPLALLISVALKQMNKKGKRESIIILDEAPTVYIPGFEELPATARSNKVATVFAAQHMAQIDSSYGRQKKDTLLGILSNQFWGQSPQSETQQYVAGLFGKHEVQQTSTSNSRNTSGPFMWLPNSRGESTTYSFQERNRVQPNDIQELNKGEFFGQLVDSDYSSYKVQFKEQKIGPLPRIEDFREVTTEQVRANFLKIQADIQEILKPKLNNKANVQKDDF